VESLARSFLIQFAQGEFGPICEEGIGISELSTELIAGVVTGRKTSLRPSRRPTSASKGAERHERVTDGDGVQYLYTLQEAVK
jgi:hypothetical protein